MCMYLCIVADKKGLKLENIKNLKSILDGCTVFGSSSPETCIYFKIIITQLKK